MTHVRRSRRGGSFCGFQLCSAPACVVKSVPQAAPGSAARPAMARAQGRRRWCAGAGAYASASTAVHVELQGQPGSVACRHCVATGHVARLLFYRGCPDGSTATPQRPAPIPPSLAPIPPSQGRRRYSRGECNGHPLWSLGTLDSIERSLSRSSATTVQLLKPHAWHAFIGFLPFARLGQTGGRTSSDFHRSFCFRGECDSKRFREISRLSTH